MLESTYEVTFEDGTKRILTLPVSDFIYNVEIIYEKVDEPPDIPQPIEAKGILQHHWWAAEVKPVRVGPTTEHWDLHILWRRDKPLMNWILRENILVFDETSAIFRWCDDHAWMQKGKKKVEYIPPSSPGNPTERTPAFVEALDWGDIRIYESSDVFMKFDIRFRKLKGHFVAVRRDPRLNLWTIRRESPKPEIGRE